MTEPPRCQHPDGCPNYVLIGVGDRCHRHARGRGPLCGARARFTDPAHATECNLPLGHTGDHSGQTVVAGVTQTDHWSNG